jgi:16S rRNA (guanine527-N7)-methyltransferase
MLTRRRAFARCVAITLTSSRGMNPEPGLAQLAELYALNSSQCEQLEALLSQLADDELAPTSVRSRQDALNVHLADSLSALDFAAVRIAVRIADLGSGAGFPGMPLAIALPGASMRLIESQVRKCAFIERARRAAGVENAMIVRRRAEDWPEGIGAHDLVLARALAAQSVVLEYAAPLLHVGGHLLDWRGRRDAEEESMAELAAEELGLSLTEIRHATPYEDAREHHLHLYLKVRETPELFPRRPGMARKRPLGARRRSPT